MTIEKTEEKRRFHRALYNAEAVLISTNISIPCKIIDISLKGCLLAFAEPLNIQKGMLNTLNITLSDDESIIMDISAVHETGNHIGFICQHIDIDSITNLRRLVELNLGNSEILDRELIALNDFNHSQ
ncbi:PilZ domain-containing protein [Methylomonas sp. AM2-LC]|uniref:PilZ domain-containing protein n=1 Tax=Methylomonas sp. AM2-LC TaxID=3153301 RepID=UPI0032646768